MGRRDAGHRSRADDDLKRARFAAKLVYQVDQRASREQARGQGEADARDLLAPARRALSQRLLIEAALLIELFDDHFITGRSESPGQRRNGSGEKLVAGFGEDRLASAPSRRAIHTRRADPGQELTRFQPLLIDHLKERLVGRRQIVW